MFLYFWNIFGFFVYIFKLCKKKNNLTKLNCAPDQIILSHIMRTDDTANWIQCQTQIQWNESESFSRSGELHSNTLAHTQSWRNSPDTVYLVVQRHLGITEVCIRGRVGSWQQAVEGSLTHFILAVNDQMEDATCSNSVTLRSSLHTLLLSLCLIVKLYSHSASSGRTE